MADTQHPIVFQPPSEADPLLDARDYIRSAIRHSTRILKSGTPERYFLDFDTVVAEPDQLEPVVELFVDKVNELRREHGADYLVFLDKGSSGYAGATVGAIALAAALSLETSLPYVLYREDKQVHSERIKLPRPTADLHTALQGLGGVLVTDHISEGDEVLEAIDTFAELGATITDCVAYTCRTDLLRRAEFKRRDVRCSYFYPFPETAERLGLSLDDTEDVTSVE